MNRKNGIVVARNHSETSIIRMKHHLVVKFGKLRTRLSKHQH